MINESKRITDDPIITAKLVSLFKRGLDRHRTRQGPEPSEIAAEREEITVMLAKRVSPH